MGNLRRVYVYTPLPDDDGDDANRFWPPGMTGRPQLPDDQSPPTSPDYPEGYFAQGGGLLGMLLRGMQQGQGQPGADSSSTPHGADGNGSPQAGLLDRLLAQQSQGPSFADYNVPTPSIPSDPNFREVSRARRTAAPQYGTADLSDMLYAPVGAGASFNGSHALPQIQGSIDPTGFPSSEEDWFRQNHGREQGPIGGAWQAPSRHAPAGSRGAGEITARPSINDILNHGPALHAGEPMPGLGTGGSFAGLGSSPGGTDFPIRLGTPIAGLGASPGHAYPPTEFQNPSAFGNGLVPPRGVFAANSTQTIPTDRSFRAYGDKPMLPWVSGAPGIQAGVGGSKKWRESPSIVPDKPTYPEWLDQEISAEDLGSGGGGDNDDGCEKEREEALLHCAKEAMKTDNWTIGYGYPYKDVKHCVQSRVSERCGGARVDHEVRKPKGKGKGKGKGKR